MHSSSPFELREGVAVSTTTYAPMTAHSTDPMREATARAAARAGMTVEAWIEHTDRIERGEKRRRVIDQTMRQVPRYRNEGAA